MSLCLLLLLLALAVGVRDSTMRALAALRGLRDSVMRRLSEAGHIRRDSGVGPELASKVFCLQGLQTKL